jgi:hypothetical protein
MSAPRTQGAADLHDTPHVQHEESDVNIRAILGFGLALLVTAVAVNVLVWLLFGLLAARESRQAESQFPLAAGLERLPPEPRLQTNPRGDLQDLRVREETILNTYGWVDKNAGVVRIPIDRAIAITLERGLPSRRSGGEMGK